MWAATWVQLQATEHALIGAATHTTENLAAEFEQYTHRAINDVDQMTRLVKHEFERHNSIDLAGMIREGLIAEGRDRVVLSIADAEGNIIARNQPFKRFSIADREYFRLHAERDTGLLDISKPVVGRISGFVNILSSRRLNHPDGSFAGIVLVAVKPQHFMEFYQESELGKRQSGIARARRDARALRIGENVTSAGDDGGPELMALAQSFRVTTKPKRARPRHAYRRLPEAGRLPVHRDRGAIEG